MACFTEPNLKKQSQFAEETNRRNISNSNGLSEFMRVKTAQKQSQTKPISYFPVANTA
jgi:hypothetical protein